MVEHTADPQVRAQIHGNDFPPLPLWLIYLCRTQRAGDIEPDLPQQIAATTEITDDGPILGPIWVTGNIPIARAYDQPFETRTGSRFAAAAYRATSRSVTVRTATPSRRHRRRSITSKQVACIRRFLPY